MQDVNVEKLHANGVKEDSFNKILSSFSCPFAVLYLRTVANSLFLFLAIIMDRIMLPLSRQLLRPRPRYPFSIPPVYAARLYSSKAHIVPRVSSDYA